jgi:hypothetical protein
MSDINAKTAMLFDAVRLPQEAQAYFRADSDEFGRAFRLMSAT